jgi:hypothetical protein
MILIKMENKFGNLKVMTKNLSQVQLILLFFGQAKWHLQQHGLHFL